jgi:pseudaminic acid cytidylyltransferase
MCRWPCCPESTVADVNLAVIPARGGSKRMPGKNVRVLAGRPSIAYAIEAARASGLFDRIVVSTDSPEIARVAQEQGAEVPFLRAEGLADDTTPVSAATVDMVERLASDGSRYTAVCQLMANCPLVLPEDVLDSHRQFVTTGAPAQISVVRYGWQNPWWALRRDADLRIEPLFADRLQQRSQDLPELFCPSGAIWWARAEVLLRERTFHVPHRTGWEMPWERAIDIDTQDDWVLAEVLDEIRRQRATGAVGRAG